MTARPSDETHSVLHLDSGRTYRGGQRQVWLLASEQLRRGRVTPLVLARSEELLARCRIEGVACQRWCGPWAPDSIWQLASQLREWRPSILHAHDARAHGALRALCSRSQQKRLVVHRRIDDPPSQSAMARWKYGRGEILCVSEAVADVLALWGVPRSRLHRVPSGLRIPETCPSRPLPTRKRAAQLLAVGALVPHKGHASLVDAMALMTEPCRLVIVGNGPEDRRLRRRVEQLGLGDRVRLESSFEKLPELLEDADLFVQPSLTEGLGTAVIEAMGSGLAVVATRAGGLPELVEDGVTGWLVPPSDPESLARILQRAVDLHQSQPDELRTHGYRGWQRAKDCFPVETMVRSVQQVYDELL